MAAAKISQKAKTQSRGKGFDLPQQDIPRGIALHFFQHIFLACGQGVEYDINTEHKGRNEQEIKRQFGRQKPFVGCCYDSPSLSAHEAPRQAVLPPRAQ